MNNQVAEIYGNKIRIRVCGVLLNAKNEALMLNHSGLNMQNIFWHFPGGGVENLESLEETLLREFKEETNLEISIEKFLFHNEFINKPLHAIELFFLVKSKEHNGKLGQDPELNILDKLDWINWDFLSELPENQRTNSIENFKSFEELINQ